MRIGLALGIALALVLGAPVIAAPATCEGDCTVDSNAFGYNAPVLVISSGSTVTWKSLDSAHVTQDGFGSEESACFGVVHNTVSDSDPVRFDIVEDALFATVITSSGEFTLACENAEALPDGSFALPYYCVLHPTMRGALVVTP